MTGSDLSEELRRGDPRIEALYEPYILLEDFKGKLTVNPEYILEGDERVVMERIRSILSNR